MANLYTLLKWRTMKYTRFLFATVSSFGRNMAEKTNTCFDWPLYFWKEAWYFSFFGRIVFFFWNVLLLNIFSGWFDYDVPFYDVFFKCWLHKYQAKIGIHMSANLYVRVSVGVFVCLITKWLEIHYFANSICIAVNFCENSDHSFVIEYQLSCTTLDVKK